MKVLYVGVYRDGTGWGHAAADYILALDAAGVDVVPRPLKLNTYDGEPCERIQKLEEKSSAGCDVVIQHVLPHQMDYNGRFRNIGLYATETSEFRASYWPHRINAMDACWVINRQMVSAARVSGVDVPLTVIPHATDIGRFQKNYKQLEVLKPYKAEGDFLFYFIGEYTRRKNLSALVKAFHLEFDPAEPVQLVIKTNKSGMSPAECKKHVESDCDKVKEGLKLHGLDKNAYKDEIVITDRLTPEAMMRLHATCDCFVMPSYGEAWCIPAFDAMAMGKTPIVTGCTGFLDYLSDKEGWLVRSHQEPVWGVEDTFADLFVGSESWASVDISHLRRCMREAYEKESLREEKSLGGIERAYDFSYHSVGQLMARALADPG